MPGPSVTSTTSGLAVGVSLAILLALVGLHWFLWRLGRRLPVAIARRSAGRDGAATPGAYLRWRRPVELTLLPIKLLLWTGGLFLISERFPALQHLRGQTLGLVRAAFALPLFTVKDRQFSALDLLLLPVALAALWVVVSLVTRLFRAWVLRATRIQAGVQESLASLLRYALLLMGGLVVLQVWGFDASTLAIFGSLLGVGIGFGLQAIANNFVSGILIGVERPIKPGDFVEVGSFTGTIERVGARSTVVRTLDRVRILVPNSRFLETEVVNWSYGDPISRLQVPVSVAYGSSPTQVRSALLAVAREQPEVLSDPLPDVRLVGFEDSAVRYDLLVWTHHPQRQRQLVSDLNFGIQAALARHGLQIPFPQVDLHLRSSHLDRIADLWTRRGLAHDEEGSLVDTLGDAAEGSILEMPLLRRSWSGEELEELASKMREDEALEIRERRHLFNRYPRCFLGREAVDWLQRHEGISRREAVEVGNLMLERGLLHHVLDEHGFEDAGLFYRFYVDEAETEPWNAQEEEEERPA